MGCSLNRSMVIDLVCNSESLAAAKVIVHSPIKFESLIKIIWVENALEFDVKSEG